MITEEYREKTLKEYADAARVFADIISDDGCNSTAFIIFKLLTDILKRLEGIEDWLTTIATDGIDTHNV